MPRPLPKVAIQPLHGHFVTRSLEHATAGDAMHPGIVSCSVDTCLTDVARLMAAEHIHSIVVLHEAQSGSAEPYVWGVISDLDLMRAALAPDPEGSAGDAAREPTISIKSTVPLRDAAELMLRHGVSHVIVTQADTLRPVGVLSSLDVAGILSRGDA